MKIDDKMGEFAFRGLVQNGFASGWRLTEEFYFSMEEFRKATPPDYMVKWPAEQIDNDLVYVPLPEEYEQKAGA